MAEAIATKDECCLDLPPPLDPASHALFADLDGTLAPIAPRPGDVGPDARRSRLLERLSARLSGRLAVISGRTLAEIDRILDAKVTAAAGLHGLARRTASGALVIVDAGLPEPARAAALALGGAIPHVLVEDKGPAIALHYRAAPEAGPACEAGARQIAERFGLDLKPGRMVVELRAAGPNKADAVGSFMAEPPFAGSRPIFLGDDITDEDGFAAAASLGGFGVVVGARRPTGAHFALPTVEAALAWLEQAAETRS